MTEQRAKVAEHEPDYTDQEAKDAVIYIKEHKLPLSDLRYALKYVRILNKAKSDNDDTEPPEEAVESGYISPPSFKLNDQSNFEKD